MTLIPSLLRRAASGLIRDRSWGLFVTATSLQDVMDGARLDGFTIRATEGLYWADPFPVVDNGRFWIFAEEFDFRAGLGSIVALRIEGEEVVARVRVLAGSHHYAFPQIHRTDEGWLASVDTCDPTGQIHVFQDLGTPWRPAPWRLPRWTVDPALAQAEDGRWIMVGSSPLDPVRYEQWSTDDATLRTWRHAPDLVWRSPAVGRSGGTLDLERGLRVSQDCARTYGEAVSIAKFSEGERPDTVVRRIDGRDLGHGFDGTHTLAWTRDGLTMVADAWTRRVHPSAVPHRVRERRHRRRDRDVHKPRPSSQRGLMVVEPVLAPYRVPMFEQLRFRLGREGYDLVVVVGTGTKAQRARGMVVELPDWAVQVPTGFGPGERPARKRLNLVSERFQPDLVVVNQAVKDMETWELLHRVSSAHAPSVAMWGHGRRLGGEPKVLGNLRQWLTRRASWFFAYTEGGAKHVVSHGFPLTRVTVLNNTIDTGALRHDLMTVSESDVQAFHRAHGLAAGRVGLFLGGVDDSKAVDFAAESAAAAHRHLDGFMLLIVGDGLRRADMEALERRGYPIRVLGRLTGREKALAMRAARVMVIPSAVGLVAVDSLAAGLPIVTRNDAGHGPEIEYLGSETALMMPSGCTTSDFGAALAGLLASEATLTEMVSACREKESEISLEAMVDRFVGGIVEWDKAT